MFLSALSRLNSKQSDVVSLNSSVRPRTNLEEEMSMLLCCLNIGKPALPGAPLAAGRALTYTMTDLILIAHRKLLRTSCMYADITWHIAFALQPSSSPTYGE
jgi:hypothetical protein